MWIQTFTGKQFWPLAPKASDVCIEDIAHALSLKCRFGGHVKKFYSVAEHCVRVMKILKPADQLWGLMHDAAEAYLPDIAAPIKRSVYVGIPWSDSSFQAWHRDWKGSYLQDVKDESLVGFDGREIAVMQTICEAFGFRGPPSAAVKQADLILLATEARDLMSEPPAPWELDVPVLPDAIEPWDSDQAEELFLFEFARLRPALKSKSITEIMTTPAASITEAMTGAA